jgi:hypothetical protein
MRDGRRQQSLRIKCEEYIIHENNNLGEGFYHARHRYLPDLLGAMAGFD